MTGNLTPVQAIDRATELYEAAAARLRAALEAFVTKGETPDPKLRRRGEFCYPMLRLKYHPDGPVPPLSRAFAKLSEPGTYEITVTQPAFFRSYFLEQLEQITADFDVKLEVVNSASEIPYPYVLEHASSTSTRRRCRPRSSRAGSRRRVSPTDRRRGDRRWRFRMAASSIPTALFTNYHRYVDQFVEWSIERLKQPGPYERCRRRAGSSSTRQTKDAAQKVNDGAVAASPDAGLSPDGARRAGITLVNIGVGPSNAKTITDHLAVLRPECWLMIGHCGGLRHSQRIGDYVLAHAYLRDDHVLDRSAAGHPDPADRRGAGGACRKPRRR
jgi:AMP nucleosidase